MQRPSEDVRFSAQATRLSENIVVGIQKLIAAKYTFSNGSFDPNMVTLAPGLVQSYDKVELIESFIKNSHIHWDKIKERDEHYFIQHLDEVFTKLSPDMLLLIKDLYFASNSKDGRHIITSSFKKNLWDNLDALVKISIKYIHKHMGIFKGIDVKYHAKVWQLEL